MPSPRSCDRCYKIKARCNYSSGSTACQRCSRLDHRCETRRAILPSGRPKTAGPSTGSPLCEVSQPSPSVLTKQISLSPFKSFADDEVRLVEYVLHPDQIASIIYGKSSQMDTRIQFFTQLTFAGDLFKDAFIVFAKAISDNNHVHFSNIADEPDAARASRAVIRLTDLNASSVDDAENALGLALLLITFNDLKIGSPTLPISRAALLRASPWQQQLLRQPNGSKLICLMFIEIFECIVLGLIPVSRYEVPEDRVIVDIYYGVCHYLLPPLYDVCVLYKKVKLGLIVPEQVFEEIRRIEDRVTGWSPISLVDELELESESDVKEHLILQAEAFKLTLQVLLLQGFRSTATNYQAKRYAEELSQKILQARMLGPARPKYLLFPYFISCLELYQNQNHSLFLIQQTMNDISNYMAPKAVTSMVTLLHYTWHRWHQHPESTWFQVIEEGIPVAMGP